MKTRCINKKLFLVISLLIVLFSCALMNISSVLAEESLLGNKLYVRDVKYYGTVSSGNTIIDDVGVDTILFNDNSNFAITEIPYKLINSELIKLPRLDKALLTSDYPDGLLSFTVFRDSYVYVMRDVRITNPMWLEASGFTNTGETIVATNTTYNIYSKLFLQGETAVIGANLDSIIDGEEYANQFVLIKEKTKVDENIFFEENFNDADSILIDNGFNAFRGNSLLRIEPITLGDRKGLYFWDDNENIAYIAKRFNNLNSNFTISYDAYVTDAKTNTWLRLFVTNGTPSSTEDKSKVALETYLDRSNDSLNVLVRDSNSTNQILASGITLNAWHNFKYYVDIENKTYTLYVDNVRASGELNGSTTNKLFLKTSINSVNYFIFGSGKSSSSDFIIDNIKITPDLGIGASAIVINDHTINLDKNITSYLTLDTTPVSESVFDVVSTNNLHSWSVDQTTYNDKAIVTLVNNNLESFEFEVVFNNSDAFIGVDVRGDVTGVNADVKDQLETFHFVDTSTTNLTYVEKSFPAINTGLVFSYDIYLENNANANDILLKSFLTNGQMMANYDSYDNVGIRSYFNPLEQTTNIATKLVGQNLTVDDTEVLSKNTWYTIRYEVNIVDHIYDVYLNGELIYEGFEFYSNVNTLNNLVIGTDYTGTADFHVKNISIEEMSGAPIESITIDGKELVGFDKNNTNFAYYTDTVLYDNSLVEVTTNLFYKSHTITKDVENQKVIIAVVDNLDNTITYTITSTDISLQNISKQQLQALYDSTLTLTSTDYTTYTWQLLEDQKILSLAVLNDSNSVVSSYAYAYYYLEEAINGLLSYEPYVEYETLTAEETHVDESIWKANYTSYEVSLVNTIEYSNNINSVFKFNKVLENNAQVYFDKDKTTLSFKSVPYKYMNAEYLMINNKIYDNASIKLKAFHDIYLLVFRDWDSGPLTNDIDINGTPTSFTDTGEIVTTSDGSIYKVYSVHIEKNETVEIHFNDLITNNITHKNNIIAFIKKYNVDNNYFFYENMNDYSTEESNDTFSRSWESFVSYKQLNNANVTQTDTSYNSIAGDPSNQYLEQKSGTNTAVPIVYKQIANLTEKAVLKFSYETITDAGITNNLWLRTWLVNFTDNGTRSITGSNADKDNVLADFYVQGTNNTTNNYPTYYVNTDKYDIKSFRTPNNIWYDYEITHDIINNSFDFSGKLSTDESFVSYVTKRPFFASMDNANHVYFSGRGQASSHGRFKDIYVLPIESGMFTNLLIDGINLTNYKDYTKDYLYVYEGSDTTSPRYADPMSQTDLVVSTSGNTIEPSFSYTRDVETNELLHSVVEGTDAGINRTHTIYYEVDSKDILGIDTRIALVEKVEQAIEIKRALYTADSYATLADEINNSKLILADHHANENEIITQTISLQNAIDNLVLNDDLHLNYSAKGIMDYNYNDDFENSSINITTDSSLTVNFNLAKRFSTSGFTYLDDPTERYLVSSHKFSPNTKIVFEDFSNNESNYYYYIVSQEDYDSNKLKYALSDFTKMGTTDIKYVNAYNYYEESRMLYENYNFIIDYLDTTIDMPNGNYEVGFELEINGNIESTTEVVSYRLYNAEILVDLTLSNTEQYYTIEDPITVILSVIVNNIVTEDGVVITDTNLDNQKSIVKISYWDPTGTIPLDSPSGLYLADNDLRYYLDDDDHLRISRGAAIKSLQRTYTLYPALESYQPGFYKIKFDFMGTYGGPNDNNILATEWIDIEVKEKPTCAILVSSNEATGVVFDNNETMNMNIKTTCTDVTDEQHITVSLYKKDNKLFDSFAYTLIDLNNYISVPLTEFNGLNNIYEIATHPYANVENTIYDDIANISLNGTLPEGTYRLVFEVRSGDIVVSDKMAVYIEQE